MTVPHPGEAAHTKGLPIVATLGALGVVYGDIGTSPLYALKEAAKAAAHGGPLVPAAIVNRSACAISVGVSNSIMVRMTVPARPRGHKCQSARHLAGRAKRAKMPMHRK